MQTKAYQDYYTWETPLSDTVIGHCDGGVSCMILWDGLDCEMTSPGQKADAYHGIYQVLDELEDCIAEFHLWRERDTSLAEAYLKQNEALKRGRGLAVPIREALASHLAKDARSNKVALVLYRRPDQGLLDTLLDKRSKKAQIQNAAKLDAAAARVMKHLAGARPASPAEYFDRVLQSFWRKGYQGGHSYPLDYRYDLAEQVILDAPRVKDGLLHLDGCTSKVILLYMYPDADPGFFLELSHIGCDMHVSQTVVPIDTRKDVDRQSELSRKDQAAMGQKGVKYAEQKILARESYTSFVAENDLKTFKNVYVIHLHGEPEKINHMHDLIASWVKPNGQVRSVDDLQAHFFRVAQPGCGCVSNFFRKDHTLQVGNMAPVIVFDQGIPGAESLRITRTGQLVGFSILEHKVSHGFTVAMTGSGKGVDKGVEIIETYGLGLDWYIAEAGLSYIWPVEGLGGQYIRFDPEKHVLNPFPDYDLSDAAGMNPLDVQLCSATANALAFLLTDGQTIELDSHQRAVAEKALQALYKKPVEGKKAPRLDHYLESIQNCQYHNAEQKLAAEKMASILDSFLCTSVGERFKHDNNLTIRPGICGIDLKKIVNMDKKLMEFCLTSIAMRYGQMAFYQSDVPSRVLFDELHEFVAVSPEVIGNLCRQVARMGRKDGASLDLVTQGLKEMKALDSEVIGSTTLRSLLYRPDQHAEMAEILRIPDAALQRWQSYRNPEKLNWRPGLRSVHERFYNLYLSFPQVLLDITTTDPNEIGLKLKISEMTADPFKRVELLRQMRLKN